MDRKIEHRPISLSSLFSNPEWNITRLLFNGIFLFFIIFLIYLMLLYTLSLLRLEEQFHPEWHRHQWENILDHLMP